MENDILCVEVVERDIIVNTISGKHEDSTLEQLDFILSRFGFERLHRSKIVNMSQVYSYDPKLGVVYFDKEKTKFCQVSRSNRHKLRKYTHLFNK